MFKPILHNLTKEDGDMFYKARAYNILIGHKPRSGTNLLDKIENQRLWELECKYLLNEIRELIK